MVVEIFRLYTYRRLGTRAIATRLNERGLRRRSGRPWSHKTVADVLVNRVYLGEIHFRDIVVDGAHPAIIDATTFDLAERILTLRGENPAKKAAAASNYHLTGKIPCPDCGRRYLGTNATGRSRVYCYYTCATRAATAYSAAPHRASTPTPSTMPSSTRWRTSAPAAWTWPPRRSPPCDDHRRARAAYHDELAVVTGQLAAKDVALDKYLADFEDNKISQQVVTRRVAQLSADVDQLRNRRDALISPSTSNPTGPTKPS